MLAGIRRRNTGRTSTGELQARTVQRALGRAYKPMAADRHREIEAAEWIDAVPC